jgi:hypothetical protein
MKNKKNTDNTSVPQQLLNRNNVPGTTKLALFGIGLLILFNMIMHYRGESFDEETRSPRISISDSSVSEYILNNETLSLEWQTLILNRESYTHVYLPAQEKDFKYEIEISRIGGKKMALICALYSNDYRKLIKGTLWYYGESPFEGLIYQRIGFKLPMDYTGEPSIKIHTKKINTKK